MERRIDRLISEFKSEWNSGRETYVLWNWHVYRCCESWWTIEEDDLWLDFMFAKEGSAIGGMRKRMLERLAQHIPTKYLFGSPSRSRATSSEFRGPT